MARKGIQCVATCGARLQLASAHPGILRILDGNLELGGFSFKLGEKEHHAYEIVTCILFRKLYGVTNEQLF